MTDRPLDTIDFRPRRSSRRRLGLLFVALLFFVLMGGGAALSYYVEALWFGSLGYGDVFWKTVNFEAAVFTVATGVTFLALYGAFRGLKPPQFGEFGTDGVIFINNQPVKVPVGPVLSLIAILVSVVIAPGTDTETAP